MKKIFSRQSGQSLLEMIFSIGFLLMTVSAILALTIANITGEEESENQVIANNLARESIEVVRNLRDSNWLAKVSWDTGLVCTGTNKCRTVFDQAKNTWRIIDDPSEQGNEYFIIYRSPDGIYSYNRTPGDTATIFSRHIFINEICRASNGQQAVRGSCQTGETKIGLKVSAVAGWREKNGLRQLTIEDLLYAWK